jgi:hypothetical protein
MSDFLPEQTPCDDGSKCTDADKCTLGAGGQLQCTGTPLVCDDGNVCTLDTCAEETGCSFSPKSDGTACGGVEKCGGQGKCQGGICQWSQGQGCDDGVACTTDTCLADGSCTNEPQDSACDDWDGCNGPETCHPTQGCQPGVPMVCNDGIVCTLDQCSNGKCSFPTDPAVCNDGNPCTNDSCVPPAGCSSTFNSAACDDGDPCTVGDLCAAGSCTGGPANNCDDANACTQDSCDPQKGCVHVPLGPECGACTPYAVEPCYDGPDGTAGKGACQKGFKQCLATGNGWSPCYGQTLPLGDDICDNGLDDDCDGTEADESCGAAPGGGVWADYDHGHDDTGNGSFNNPYQTMAKAVASNSKLVMLKADADGTIYPEEVHVGAVVSGFTVKGWGPTRPILQGRLDLVHCYDCVFENIEFRYPKPGQFANDIGGAVDTVHNYRNTFRKVKLSAPDGLPSGYSLARCHHGYDNLWVDIEIDDVVLLPKDGSSSHTLLNWQDHGSGSQFVRVKMGSKISVSGGLPSQIGITFISVGGYCSTWPKGVSGIRNCVAGNLDLQGLSTGSSSFTAFNYWCYFPTEAASGLTVANNTVAHVTAGNVTAFTSSQAFDFEVEVTSNVFGPFTGSSTVGVSSGNPIQVRYTDIWGVLTAYSGQVSAGVGNISKDPIYKSPQIGDFHLVPGSPCINTGDPQFPDLDGTAADMGAFGGPYAAW